MIVCRSYLKTFNFHASYIYKKRSSVVSFSHYFNWLLEHFKN